jgi:hypothetical protein
MSLIKNISTYLLSKKESPKTVKQFFSWNQLSKVLIICYDNQLSDIVDFINACKVDNISVHVAVIFNGKLEQAPKPHFEHSILDQKQFSFFNLPNETIIQKINAKSFDLLINLGDSEQMQSLALCKLVAAKCKLSNFQNSIFDMTIEKDDSMNISNYLKQVILYLKMIKTK